MRSSEILKKGILFCVIAVLGASCSGKGEGGGSSSGHIGLSPLIVTDKVSVVTPQTQSSVSGKPQLAGKQSIAPLLFGAVLSDLTASSDYVNDKVSVYVNERSLESFRSVNEILCMIRQSRYDLMLNKGPYRAQVDKNLCSSNRDSASSAGQSSTDQSSGSTMPQYETWTVDSYRTSAQCAARRPGMGAFHAQAGRTGHGDPCANGSSPRAPTRPRPMASSRPISRPLTSRPFLRCIKGISERRARSASRQGSAEVLRPRTRTAIHEKATLTRTRPAQADRQRP